MKTIIVDDEQWMLRHFEYECNSVPEINLLESFRNPLKALEYIEHNDVELVFLDVEMPDMDGITLATKLRQEFPKIVIIIVSAYESHIENVIEQKIANSCMFKPYDHDDLLYALSAALKNR